MTNQERMNEIDERIKKLDSDRRIIEDHWVAEIKSVSGSENFDPNSKDGEKILLEVTEKYTPLLAEIDVEKEELIYEYNSLLKENNKDNEILDKRNAKLSKKSKKVR